jgi:hypothetical protein
VRDGGQGDVVLLYARTGEKASDLSLFIIDAVSEKISTQQQSSDILCGGYCRVWAFDCPLWDAHGIYRGVSHMKGPVIYGSWPPLCISKKHAEYMWAVSDRESFATGNARLLRGPADQG